jgi:hypothetical protein
MAGEMSEEELLMSSHGSGSALVESRYFVALAHLAKGDRPTARLHLQAALDTGDDNYVCFEYSVLLLRHLDMNPNWPPTIPAKTHE